MSLPVNMQQSRLPALPDYKNITERFQSALTVADDVISKNYIMSLADMEIVEPNAAMLKDNIEDHVRFFKITEMVYEKDEFAVYKFASVFSAFSVSGGAIFIIIDSNGSKTDFYMGVRSQDGKRTSSSIRDIVKNAMKGQFPGIKIAEDYTIAEMENILRRISANTISAVSCVANYKDVDADSNNNFVQGLEKLVLSMQGQKYTGIIIANSASPNQVNELRKGYEQLYTQLSPFAAMQVNYTNNNSVNNSTTKTEGRSHAATQSESESRTENRSSTHSTSASHSKSQENTAGRVIKGLGTASTMLGAALAPVTGGASLGIGMALSAASGLVGTAVSKNVSDSSSTSESETSGTSSTTGRSRGTTDTVNSGFSATSGQSFGMSEGMTLTLHDKSVEGILDRIGKQLERLEEFESLGMYECAAYFMSEDMSSAEAAAYTYKALMCGEKSGVEAAAVNTWGPRDQSKRKVVEQYVKNFIHPVFRYNGAAASAGIEVTPCTFVSGNELAIHMGLPRRSVPGLPVVEHADFGKEIVTYDGKGAASDINLGKVFNMGSEYEDSKVYLNRDSMTMHTFVTGATGSGKSNTIYEIIRQLDRLGVGYLIIEPAKGEYKHVFGNERGVRVLGSNPQQTELLRINPFKFPKGIHVLEHVDRLIEIFNVCWPMYAAMPAVLKSAIEQSYIDCGWNLARSNNKYEQDLFPSFVDVTRNIKTIIDTSEYDDDNKGAYKGSLITRLQSLTNGIYGMIFTCDDISDAELFDKNVIVDLSRVGSSETKSLIMGMLVVKLQEYRMVTSTGMNEKLKHVTILEEAHNLLRRTSIEQSSDSGNLRGKSVEMLTNAIAEMRTYGEGFVIADQAPGLLDLAVIRNTNTKIIMRLPDHSDRELVGQSANLNDDQIDEIAKLPCGVAAVYQNDWIQPVLCKVSKYDRATKLYSYTPSNEVELDDAKNNASDSLLDCIMGKDIFGAGNRTEIRHLTNKILRCNLDTNVKKDFIEYVSVSDDDAIASLRHLLYSFLSAEKAITAAVKCNNIKDWVHTVVEGLSPSIKEYSNKQIDLVLALILYEKSLYDSKYNDIFCRFTEIYKSEGGVF